MFIIERSGLKLGRGFWTFAIILMLISGALGLTMHVHYTPEKKNPPI